MSNDKKVHHIRGGKEVSKEHAKVTDFIEKVSNLEGQTESSEKIKENLNERLALWSTNEDGDIVITEPDGTQTILDDD